MKLLLAVDETTASQFAAEEVAGRPWPDGTSVEVLTVVEQAHMWGISSNVENAYDRANELVDRIAVALRDAGLHVHTNVATGDPKTVLRERAEDTRPDLVVVGSHRAAPIADIFLGNVAAHVLRHADASVAIVRPRLGERVEARKILLATDGSESSNAAAAAIAALPWPPRTEVRVLSVVEVVLPTMHALFEPPFVESDHVHKLREEAVTHAQSAITTAAAILAPSGLPVTEALSVLLEGTKDVILQDARDWGADWIFLGSHGRRGAERFLMGSISESVAAQAQCSVQVVRTRAKSPAAGSESAA